MVQLCIVLLCPRAFRPALEDAMEEPIFISINDFCRRFGIARTKTYELIRSGEIEVAKVGRRTLVSFASAKDLLERSLGRNS